MAAGTITVKFFDDSMDIYFMEVNKESACMISDLICGVVELGADVVDFTSAPEGQEPLSPSVINGDILRFISQDPNHSLILKKSYIAPFMKRFEALSPTSIGWDYVDILFEEFVKAENRAFVDDVDDDTELECCHSIADSRIDIMVELVPFIVKMPKTKQRFIDVMVIDDNRVDFRYNMHPQVEEMLKEAAFVIVRIWSSIEMQDQHYFRTVRYSDTPKDPNQDELFVLMSGPHNDGVRCQFASRSY